VASDEKPDQEPADPAALREQVAEAMGQVGSALQHLLGAQEPVPGPGTVVTAELTVDGRARRSTLRLPTGASGDIPLLLALHGNHPDATGQTMRQWTTFDQQADAWGFAIAYPDGVGGCWADGRGVTTADEVGVDDVLFLRAVIHWSAQRYGTAADRAVVAGISNGAFMAHRMGVDAGDQVAVIAAVAGGLPASLSEVTPTHAVSAMLIHGTADKMSPIGGGYSRHRGPNGELRGRTLSLEETAEFWRSTDRCPPGPGDQHRTESSSRDTVVGGVGGTQVAAWTLFDGGHTWPTKEQEFDAAEEICRFAQPLLVPAAARRL
jgi:polyhydroxybutyrate depolymerase